MDTKIERVGSDEGLLQSAVLNITLAVHPSFLGNVKKGVTETLNGMLMVYFEEVGGVIMAFNEARVLNRLAEVMPYLPFFKVNVEVKAMVFSPKKGMKIGKHRLRFFRALCLSLCLSVSLSL